MDLGLQGRRALVTAASRGLGRACAEALAREGAKVFTCARDEATLKDLDQQIGGAGYRVADLSDRAQVEAAVAAAVEAMGGLDILVVNAGGAPPGTLEQVDDEMFLKAFHLTTMSAVWLWRSSLPHLKRSGQGRVVNLTSAFVKEPSSLLLLSNAFRPGVTAMAKMLSVELAPTGVTVNCIAPNAILTDRTRSIARGSAEKAGISLEAQLERNAGTLPMARYGEAAELGDLCAYLCSAQAGYITGQTIVIDGGTAKSIF
jgi:3-oxoacyl-[acyl-carrier protein] reductase